VSRFKICLYELGDGSLSEEEKHLIRKALQGEASRLKSLSADVEFGEAKPHIAVAEEQAP
jgi:hypothetical protein